MRYKKGFGKEFALEFIEKIKNRNNIKTDKNEF